MAYQIAPIRIPWVTLRSFTNCKPFQNVIFTAQRYASAVYAVVVCLSVCSSVCHSTKTAKPRIIQTTPYDSPRILFFWRQRSRVSEIVMESPQRVRQIQMG